MLGSAYRGTGRMRKRSPDVGSPPQYSPQNGQLAVHKTCGAGKAQKQISYVDKLNGRSTSFASPKKVSQGTMLFGRVRMNYYQASVPTSEVGAV
jgi:hypothetical protein